MKRNVLICHVTFRKSVVCVGPGGIDDSPASCGHGADKTVDGGHVDVGPDPPDSLLQLICCCEFRLCGVQLPLHMVPQVLYGVEVWAERWPLQQLDAGSLQVVCVTLAVWGLACPATR